MAANQKQDLCPICTEPFKFKEAVVAFSRWDHEENMKAHFDCLLYFSAVEEDRKHPPLNRLFR
jgi:hypothetical protein